MYIHSTIHNACFATQIQPPKHAPPASKSVRTSAPRNSPLTGSRRQPVASLNIDDVSREAQNNPAEVEASVSPSAHSKRVDNAARLTGGTMSIGESKLDRNLSRTGFPDWFLYGYNTYRRYPGRLILGSVLLTASSLIFAFVPGGRILSAIAFPPLIEVTLPAQLIFSRVSSGSVASGWFIIFGR